MDAMNLVMVLVAGINIGVVLGAWWATGRVHEPHESWPENAAGPPRVPEQPG